MSFILHTLNATSDAWFDFGAAMFGQSSLLFAVLLVLELLLRRHVRAALRHACWLLFLLKLVLPPSLVSPTGAGYWLAPKLPVSSGTASTTLRTQLDARFSQTVSRLPVVPNPSVTPVWKTLRRP